MRIDNKPIFVVYNPTGLPNANEFIALWNRLAKQNGLDGIYFIAYQHFGYKYKDFGFDALTPPSPSHLFRRIKFPFLDKLIAKFTPYKLNQLRYRTLKLRNIFTHQQIVDASDYSDIPESVKFFPSCSPNWDHTPRSKYKGQVIVETKPELFYKNLVNCFNRIKNYKPEEKIIFVKAWNEWAEGNYLEPDSKTGYENLNQIKKFQEE